MPQPPVILMAFSNDREGKFLRNISEEHQKLKTTISPLAEKGLVQLIDLPNASLDDIFQTFKRYKDRVAIFHYGGHAHDMELLFSQQQNPVDMAYFAKYLAQQKGLRLVFFNACTTLPQLHVLQEAGISHLILTDTAINDEAAKLFSESFYQHMASGRTVSRSFQEAAAEVETKVGGSTRGLIWEGQHISLDPSLPWKHIASSHPDWALPTQKPFPLRATLISLFILLLSVLA
ncbi:MAG: CHAT domain-containing protein, partial [Bacteroidota bacterium]